MENIINNPGLQHLNENIFLNLNYEDLKKCQFINQSTKDIWKYPMFWIKWIKFKCIQESLTKSDGEKINISYLKCNFKRGMALEKIIGEAINWAARMGYTAIVNILLQIFADELLENISNDAGGPFTSKSKEQAMKLLNNFS